MVKLKDFYKFITDDSGALREHLFESNVRHFQGPTKVNKEIQATLIGNDPALEFWWLNNGVTILASDLSGDRELLSVTDPLIVNGLQTSFVIHEHFTSHPDATDERMIMVRLVKASDPALTDAIIKATNSQTYIPPAWLHATEDIHRNIETVFRGKDLYYDRRKGFHRRQGVPASKIVPLPYLAQAVVAIALRRPDEARARPTSFVATHYKKIFPKDVAMVAVCDVLENASPRRDSIAKVEVGLLTDAQLRKAFFRVNDTYRRFDGTDTAAKGPEMLRHLEVSLASAYPRRNQRRRGKPAS